MQEAATDVLLVAIRAAEQHASVHRVVAERERMRRWWLDRFSLDELRAIGAAISPGGWRKEGPA